MQILFNGTPDSNLPAACRSIKPKGRKSDKGAVQVSYNI